MLLQREAFLLLAVLLLGGMCCPTAPAASSQPSTTRNKRSIASSAVDQLAGALMTLEQDKEEEKEERLEERSRHLQLNPFSEHLYWLRSGECPDVEEGTKGFFCPTPDVSGQWRCVTEFQLCDHMRDCPNGEDEHPTHCLFYSVIQTHFSRLTKSLLLRPITSKHNRI